MKKKLLIFVFSSIIFSGCIFAQKISEVLLTAEDFLNVIKLDTNSINKKSYYKHFNFKEFLPIDPLKNNNSNDIYYIIYTTKDNVVSKIEFYNRLFNNKDYDINIVEDENYYYYTIGYYINSRKKTKLFYGDYFFLYDKVSKKNICFLFNSSEGYSNSFYLEEIDCKNIVTIFEVDSLLNPVNRLDFDGGDLVTFVNVSFINDSIRETIHILNTNACRLETNLKNMELKDLYYHFEGLGCYSIFKVFYERQIDGYIKWEYPYFGYD